MHHRILTLLIFPLALLASPARASDNDAMRTALHLLDYIAVDDGTVQDGKVLHRDEYAEMAQLVLR